MTAERRTAVQGVDTMLSCAELAEIYGLARRTVLELHQKGEIPQGTRLGKHWRWFRDVIADDLERRRREANSNLRAVS